MWVIDEIISGGTPQPENNIWVSDGQPVSVIRGGNGMSYRVFFDNNGFIDVTDLGLVPSPGNSLAALDINGQILYYPEMQECAPLIVVFSSTTDYSISDGSYSVTGTLTPYPEIDPADITLVQAMENNGYIPYRNDPNTKKTPAEIKKEVEQLGAQYFPFSNNSYELALSVYDWTTADFFRMDLFHLYSYTGMQDVPLNLPEIAQGLSTSNWGIYQIGNANFMNSFMLQALSDPSQVLPALETVEEELRESLNALARITIAAKYLLPRVSLAETPMLYSGQVAIQNLTNDAMAAYFLECPSNEGPAGTSISMPIDTALAGFMAPGNTVTLKSFISFTAFEAEAEQYSNGLLLILSPKPGTNVWGEGITNITPLSDQPETKNEYTFSPGAQLQIDSFEKKTYNGVMMTVIYMTYLDNVVSVPGIN